MSNLKLDTDSALMPPIRLVEPSGWSGHIPFAMWFVAQFKPRLLVELGTHTGNSYFSFCQSVQSNGLSSSCYAVDTWLGDEHAGCYSGEEVYSQVLNHNQENYSSFSHLLRMTFDEAIGRFDDKAIDLLHIDGLHTYEAVQHDYETWLPKLSEQGVVFFHDINVHQNDFGVWKLWKELSGQFPHISFDHSHGLGVLFVGNKQPQFVKCLLEECSAGSRLTNVRSFFERVGFGLSIQISSETALANRVKHIDQLEQNRMKLEAKIEQLYTGNEALKQQAKLQAKQQEEQAKRQANSLHEMQKLLSQVMNSRSWRITKPLRLLGRRFRSQK